MEKFRIVPVGALAVNCYLVFLEKIKMLLVVDPGDDADLILSAAEGFPYERAAILLTHAHVDHIGAVPEVKKALNAEFVYLAGGDEELYHSPDNHILPYLPPVAGLPSTTPVWDVPEVKLLLTSGKVVDSISNFSVVKLFAGAERERTHLEPIRNQHIAARIWSFFVQRLFWGVPAVIWDISYGATLVFCAYLYMKGQITLSEIVFTVSIYFNTMGTIGRIVDQIPVITEQIGSATKAYAELVVPVDIIDVPNAPALKVTDGSIKMENIWFKYKRKWVLQDFSLTIKPGERVGIVGASGAGKTTLVNLLMRFYKPNRGTITIDDQDIGKITQNSLRESIGFIPQEPTMFNRTLRENIAYGKPGASLREIRAAAKRAAADEFIMGTDKKYDSMVGDRGIKLSGGQRQRVAIARAFLKDAPILVLDEATSALDSETEVAIQSAFDTLAHGRTTIAIAHRLSTLRNMDRIVVMKDGAIIEQGSHSALLRKRGEYARLWKMQSGGFLQD